MHTVKAAGRTALLVIDVLEACAFKTMDLAVTRFEGMTRVSAVKPPVMASVESGPLVIDQRYLSGSLKPAGGVS